MNTHGGKQYAFIVKLSTRVEIIVDKSRQLDATPDPSLLTLKP
ncbi:MAG: hypothetical protein ACK6AD_08100 [Cyanobacteriota bacterium]|jgi:hypothetical protein